MRIDCSLSPHFLKSVEDNVKASVCLVSEIFFYPHAFFKVSGVLLSSLYACPSVH